MCPRNGHKFGAAPMRKLQTYTATTFVKQCIIFTIGFLFGLAGIQGPPTWSASLLEKLAEVLFLYIVIPTSKCDYHIMHDLVDSLAAGGYQDENFSMNELSSKTVGGDRGIIENECENRPADDDSMFNLDEIIDLESSILDALGDEPSGSSGFQIGHDSQVQEILQGHSFKQTILARRKRAVLNAQTAEDIFRLGVALAVESRTSGTASAHLSRRSMLVSQLYGISPKAVRDIWNRYIIKQLTIMHQAPLVAQRMLAGGPGGSPLATCGGRTATRSRRRQPTNGRPPPPLPSSQKPLPPLGLASWPPRGSRAARRDQRTRGHARSPAPAGSLQPHPPRCQQSSPPRLPGRRHRHPETAACRICRRSPAVPEPYPSWRRRRSSSCAGRKSLRSGGLSLSSCRYRPAATGTSDPVRHAGPVGGGAIAPAAGWQLALRRRHHQHRRRGRPCTVTGTCSRQITTMTSLLQPRQAAASARAAQRMTLHEP